MSKEVEDAIRAREAAKRLGLTGKKYEDFADVLVNLGNKGASTESEIIEVTKKRSKAEPKDDTAS